MAVFSRTYVLYLQEYIDEICSELATFAVESPTDGGVFLESFVAPPLTDEEKRYIEAEQQRLDAIMRIKASRRKKSSSRSSYPSTFA